MSLTPWRRGTSMKPTQIHLIDPSLGMILVTCADGARVVFGSHVGIGSQNEVLQRLFEVLEDGQIDYLVHAGVETEAAVSISAIHEFFGVKACLERAGTGIAWPQAYVKFRAGREVETVEADDVMEFGETKIRLLSAAPRAVPEGLVQPVALRVSHGDDNPASAAVCAGATNGLDWLDIIEGEEETFRSACLLLDGRRPLDMIVTARQRGMVSADPLRRLRASTVLLGADPEGENELRVAAREVYAHFTKASPGGAGLVEVKPNVWFTVTLDGRSVGVDREMRALGKVA